MNELRMNEQMSKRGRDKSYLTCGDMDMTQATSGSGEQQRGGELGGKQQSLTFLKWHGKDYSRL